MSQRRPDNVLPIDEYALGFLWWRRGQSAHRKLLNTMLTTYSWVVYFGHLALPAPMHCCGPDCLCWRPHVKAL